MSQQEVNAEQDAALNRIRKLLRLGCGSNHPAEAEAALAKAAQIAAAVGLELAGIDASIIGEPAITHEAGGVRRRSHSRQCCHNVLRRHFGVEVLGNSVRGNTFIGPAVNIAIARHVEQYLLQQCAAAWTVADKLAGRRDRGPGRARKTREAFEFGFYIGIDGVLAARPVRNDAAVLGRAIERYMGSHFHVVNRQITHPEKRYQADAHAGYLCGAATRVDRPVEGVDAMKSLTNGGAV